MTRDEVRTALHDLPEEEREELALEIFASSYKATDAEKAELDRRLQAIEDGTAKLIPAEEAIANARAKLHARHRV